jgi:hypothetical protein
VSTAHPAGPGEYGAPGGSALGQGPAYTMPTAPRHEPGATTRCPSPAPGEYDVARTSLEGPAYTMAGRHPTGSPAQQPGPGPGGGWGRKVLFLEIGWVTLLFIVTS